MFRPSYRAAGKTPASPDDPLSVTEPQPLWPSDRKRGAGPRLLGDLHREDHALERVGDVVGGIGNQAEEEVALPGLERRCLPRGGLALADHRATEEGGGRLAGGIGEERLEVAGALPLLELDDRDLVGLGALVGEGDDLGASGR